MEEVFLEPKKIVYLKNKKQEENELHSAIDNIINIIELYL